MTKSTLIGSVGLLLATVTLHFPPTAQAETIQVQPGESIAAALLGAQPGDAVELLCGIYREQGLVLPEGVTLRSAAGQAGCVTLVGDGLSSILRGENLSAASRLEGLIFQGDPFTAEDPATVVQGGALHLSAAAPTVVGCRFENLRAIYGGAVFAASGSRPAFADCVFRGNRAEAVGGALAAVDGCRPSFTSCLVADNSAAGGGGAFNAARGSHVLLDHCTVADNADPARPLAGALSFWADSGDTVSGTILVDAALWVGDHQSLIRADCSNLYTGGGAVPADPSYGSFISLDPLFCVNLAGDHGHNLDEASPCTPEASPECGGMGALPVGCAMSPVGDPRPGSELLPLVTRLNEAYPNPFNPRTTIKYDLRRPGAVSLAVFDVAGRLVRRLVDEPKEAGRHEAVWTGLDRQDRPAAAGVYFIRLKTADARDIRRVTLVK